MLNFFLRGATLCALLFVVAACDTTTPAQHLTTATEQYNAGEYSAAVIELKNALQKDGQLVAARALLGQVYLRQGDFPSALKELERALDLGDDSVALRSALQRTRLGLGRTAEVIGDLAEQTNRPLELDLVLADAYLTAGELDLAAPLYERGRESSRGASGLAALAWQRGDIETARQLFAQSVQADVEDPVIWIRKAEFELAAGETEAAGNSFVEAARFPSGFVTGSIGGVRTLLDDGKTEEASLAIDRVLKVAPNYPLARYLEGLIKYQTEDFETAEAALQEVQRQFPDHEPTLYLMGLIKYRLGQTAQAEYNVERFVATTPANESARKLLASIRLEQGKTDAAIDALLPVGSSSEDPQLLAMLGTTLTQAGRAAEATDYLSRAVALAPDGAAFRNQLALNLLSAGKEELARSELESAIEVDGEQIQSDYLIAMLQLRDGELSEARQSIASLIQKDPDTPVGPNLLGAVALAEGDNAVAETEFRKALQLDAGFTPALNNLARLLEANGDRAAAEALFRSRVEAAPNDIAARLGLTEVLVRDGRLGDALEAARTAAIADPKSLRAQVALVRLLRVQGEAEAAETAVDEALTYSADNPDLKLLKAELALAGGRPEDARGAVDDLQALFVASESQNAELALALGRMQAQLGNTALARSNYEAAVANSTDRRSLALIALGRLNLSERRYDDVSDQLKQLDQLGDEAAGPARRLLRADFAAARGQMDDAKTLYEELRADTGSRQATLRLAQLAITEGRAAEGISLLEEQVGTAPDDGGARLLLSGALLAENRKDEAIAQYEALEASGNPVALNNLAWLYMERGDQRALEVGQRAYEAAPGNAEVADTYGWVLVQMGDLDQGISVLENSLELGSDNPTVLYHLAAAHQKAGDPVRARRRLEEALGLGDFPERGDAEALRARLSGS